MSVGPGVQDKGRDNSVQHVGAGAVAYDPAFVRLQYRGQQIVGSSFAIGAADHKNVFSDLTCQFF